MNWFPLQSAARHVIDRPHVLQHASMHYLKLSRNQNRLRPFPHHVWLRRVGALYMSRCKLSGAAHPPANPRFKIQYMRYTNCLVNRKIRSREKIRSNIDAYAAAVASATRPAGSRKRPTTTPPAHSVALEINDIAPREMSLGEASKYTIHSETQTMQVGSENKGYTHAYITIVPCIEKCPAAAAARWGKLKSHTHVFGITSGNVRNFGSTLVFGAGSPIRRIGSTTVGAWAADSGGKTAPTGIIEY